ncbi:MAG TPA: DUF3046 domain-containing protein [Plantibacter sp.]|uniref:DUF3046 domain-containing protein n=1 Tax=unclassified Plantibacter TaxID=2624265 RepID=UPI002C616466|nr:DUF3046 domain-containing protein [Plantibacter sp.]
MKLSEFRTAVSDEFGAAYGAVLTNDLGLTEFGSKTAEEALRSGAAPREVWIALCSATDVPEDRRHGVGRLQP